MRIVKNTEMEIDGKKHATGSLESAPASIKHSIAISTPGSDGTVPLNLTAIGVNVDQCLNC